MSKISFSIFITILSLFPLIANGKILNQPKDHSKLQRPLIVDYGYTMKGNKYKIYRQFNVYDNITYKDINPDHINNHGWVFSRSYWIESDSVPIILNDDYKEIAIKDLQSHDVLITYKNDKVVYSRFVCDNVQPHKNCLDIPQQYVFYFSPTKIDKLKNSSSIKAYRRIINHVKVN